MNSFLKHSSDKITIWDIGDANLQIWQLESFDTILGEHYSAPEISLGRWSQAQRKWSQNTPGHNSNQWWEPWWNLWVEDSDSDNTKKKLHLASIIKSHATNTEPTPSEPANTPVNTPSQPQSFKPSTIINNNSIDLNAIKSKYKDMLYANLDMISNRIIDNTKRQSAMNSVVTKFMKTFNIIPTQWEFGSIDFNTSSNLFDIIQIIEETGNPKTGEIQSLEYFNNTFMPTIMKYSWLEWWNNNIHGSQRTEKNKDNYDIILDKSKDNDYISSIRENVNDFTQNLWKFQPGKTRNYDSDYKLWFVEFIKNNFVEWSGPNWKLSFSKMETFIKKLLSKDNNNGK